MSKQEFVYGEDIPEKVLSESRFGHNVLLTLCGLGIVAHILAFSATAVEYLCVVIYFLYNVIGMLVVRIAVIAFKFEDSEMLKMTIRIGSAMILYGIIVAITVAATFTSEIALRLMAVCGLINALILIPTHIRENAYLHRARAAQVGVETGRPLNSCENCVVVSFLIGANLLVTFAIAIALGILVTGATKGQLFVILIPVYIVMNIIPILFPKIQHLIATETRLWTIKGIILHMVLVLIVFLLLIPTFARAQSKTIQRTLGAVGVINGILAATAITANAIYAIHAPRTKEKHDSRAIITKDQDEKEDGIQFASPVSKGSDEEAPDYASTIA